MILGGDSWNSLGPGLPVIYRGASEPGAYNLGKTREAAKVREVRKLFKSKKHAPQIQTGRGAQLPKSENMRRKSK